MGVRWDLGWDFEKDTNWDLCQYSGVTSSNGQSEIVKLMGLEGAPPTLDPIHFICHLKAN